ncbi:hypothetical protein DC366_04580 [Pelagivirga sediminicola]|uniref:Uncharacterized protein n=1 Tax=Pelagivirga sediminicola TaxID=2170575 RepID=A0A2T7GAD3_9RHOB|nr:DUF542 domain-containing protein [Pelagivirga sediminicola]PVA11369.1 hypothetical protein DC366_04580 [Pelagivirga sediminicola]
MSCVSDPFQTRPVGQITAPLPGATSVFRHIKLVFCCHGDVPLQEAADRRGMDAFIDRMRHDDDDDGQTLQRHDSPTYDRTPSEDNYPSSQALYSGLAQFKADLMEHIHLENNIRFPRFEGASHA